MELTVSGRSKRILHRQLPHSIGMTDMSAAALRGMCQQHDDLYVTPALNDRLYCNFAGFGRLGGLEEYTSLRALFLEGNALQDLEGLPPLPLLTCL